MNRQNDRRKRILRELIQFTKNMQADLENAGGTTEFGKGYLKGKLDAFESALRLLDEVETRALRPAPKPEPKLWESEEQVLNVLVETLDKDEAETK